MHNCSNDDLSEDEKKLLEELLSDELSDIPGFGEQRRIFLKQIAAASAAVLVSGVFGADELHAAPPGDDAALAGVENALKVSFQVNGSPKSITIDSRMTLLDSLREKLGLTGSKKGCDHGQCGACTVMVEGKRVLSCLTLAASCEGRSVTTIEGIAKNGNLHPMQTAFIKHDGFQCGFCTPGQICSAVAMMTEIKNGEASYVTPDVRKKLPAVLPDDEIRERMSGNLCRCGAYPNILASIKEVHSGKEVAQGWSFAGEEFSSTTQNAE